MTKPAHEDPRDTQSELVRSGCIATVWVLFYVLVLTHAVSGPSRSSMSATVTVPNSREAVADIARVPTAPVPVSSNGFSR